MPNPLTSEERARLADDLLFAAKWAIGDPESRSLAERAAVELARTADDARDAEIDRLIIQNVRWELDEAEPNMEWVKNTLAALASSKSEAAEGGEDE